MRDVLDPEHLLSRLKGFVQYEAEKNRLDPRSFVVLEMAYLRGYVPKGEIEDLLGVSERHARRIISPLVDRGLLESESRTAPFTIGFPLDDAQLIFPRLFEMPTAVRPSEVVSHMPTP